MQRLLWALALLALCACGKHKTNEPEPATDPQQATYDALVADLPSFLDAGGWVVSRGGNTNQGDSLFFSSLALYALECDEGEPIAAALEKQMLTGKLVRYPGLAQPLSFDGQLALMRGLVRRMNRCGEHDRWKAALSAVKLDSFPNGFDYVRRKALANFSLGDAPSKKDQVGAELEMAAFAAGAVQSHGACFRAHLSLIALQTMEDAGDSITDTGATAFCDGVRGGGIATAEAWCGRGGLAGYLDAFKRDEWVYKHQRCEGWESPDAKGDQEPGVDYLVAFRDQDLGL